MAESNIVQGYLIHEGYYRCPDLLTESQLIEYFRDTYNIKLTIEHLGPKGTVESELGSTGQQVTSTENTEEV